MFRKFSNFVDLLRHKAIEHGDRIAFTFLQDGETELTSITYQKLDEQARAIAATLENFKAKGERALLLYQPGLEFISAFLGCLYAGAIAVPAYPPKQNRSIHRLQAIISDAKAAFALTTKSLVDNVQTRLGQSVDAGICCLATDSLALSLADDWQSPQATEDTLAFLQYTSGSTGTPKGVMVGHGNLLHNLSLIRQGFGHTTDSKGVIWLPPYHDMGLIGGILQPLYVGFPVTLLSHVSFLQRPLRWLQTISRYGASTSGGPNFAYELCVSQITDEQKDTLDLSSWELAFTGAEPVRAETIERFTDAFSRCGFRREAFYPCYGMAETTLLVSGGLKGSVPVVKMLKGEALKQNQAIAATPTDKGAITLVGCGQAIDQQQVVIANPETLARCAVNEIGEVWVKGESVTQGYWERPNQTQATFKAYLADTAEGPFLRTGDLGFIQDGELFITGRLKDLIIIRGRNHYPQDIEQTVERSHAALRTGCSGAFAVDVDGGEQLGVVVEVKRSYLRKLNAQEIIKSIRKAIVEHHEMQPYAILLLKTSTIPKTSSGKIARHACKAGFYNQSLDTVEEWRDKPKQPLNITQLPTGNDQTKIQDWLVAQISQGLGVSLQEIDIQEPFASYGLDSVRAVRLSAQLEDWLGYKLTPTLVYDYPTIASLSQYLAQLATNEAPTPHIPHPTPHTLAPIAIVGIGCRFPGANHPAAFWELLRSGTDAIHNQGRGEGWGGFLEGVDRFDPQFFGISPREATRMDPQQRLLLEVSWEALEAAGIAPDQLTGSRTGVFVGISSSDYSNLQLRVGAGVDAYTGTGNAHSIAANRLSYFLDLCGPSLSVDTACSSSLVAVHLACQSLQNGECDQAIVGGVNLILASELTQSFTQAGMMAADGRCKTFDASADGYVRGEGCGVIILKRLEQAVEGQDKILAVVKGTAINQDGRSNGLTAPNGLAQQEVIRQALAKAKLNPAEISYVEAHGTGTALGDPIEVNSLKEVLMQERSPEASCFLGSAKTNIGHLEAAAGIAGLIKVVLALQHQEIPPNLHFNQLNPHIDLKATPIAIPTQIQPWTSDKPRFAGVSSFGFGGTNAHVVIGDWAGEKPSAAIDSSNRPRHLLTLSAKTPAALADLVKSYQDYLTNNLVPVGDICFTANTGRSHFNHRLAVITQSSGQLHEQLLAFSTGETGFISGQVPKGIQPKIVFLFTGQGSQSVGMGRQLYETQPTFRAALDRCAEILEPDLEKPLLEVLYPGLNGSDNSPTPHTPHPTPLNRTAYTQPAIFAIEYALAKLWLSWGIKPDLVMGHSVGEYAAACIAGVFSLEDGLKLIAERGRLMQALPKNGAMVAVFADEARVKAAISPYEQVAIAALNGSHVVISGESQAVEAAIVSLRDQGVKTKRLKVSHAFHSPLMEPIQAEFEQAARSITYASPQINIVANVTGSAGGEIATPQYWVNHVREPVRFAPSLELLKEQGYQIFLELGPKPILLGMGRYCLPTVDALWLPSLRPGQEDWQQMLDSLARLSIRGVKVDWSGFDKDYQRHRVDLPTYPFQRQRYWLEQQTVQPQPVAPKSLDQYTIQWQPQERTGRQGDGATGTWLIFADRQGVGVRVAQQLESGHCLLIYRGEYAKISPQSWYINPNMPEDYERLFQEAGLDSQLKGIIHLWSLDTPTDDLTASALEQSQQLSCGSVLYLVQTLFKQAISSPLWLVTRGTQAISEAKISLAAAPLWGLGKVIALEHPELWGGAIDLSPALDEYDVTNLVTEVINAEADQIAFRRQRYVARLVKEQTAECRPNLLTAECRVSSDSTYLITGGLGALGLKVAQWLVEQGAKHLVLVGRSAPSTEASHSLQALEEAGANLLVAQADISREQDVVKVLQTVDVSMPPLKGVIHAAGVLDDGTLQGQTWSRFAKVMAPKVLGAWHLHNLTRDLDFFVLFSSVASLLGSPGQGNYAAANAFLDAIAHHRHYQGLPALSINWGPWKIGMAVSPRMTARGLTPLETSQGLAALAQLISQQTVQRGVFSVDWEELGKHLTLVQPYFQAVLGNTPSLKATPQPFEQLLAMPSRGREEFLVSYLRSLVAQLLQMSSDQISPAESLLDLGMDSLMVMEAINKLKSDLQLMLYPREFYERPQINALAKYLATEFEKTYANQPTSNQLEEAKTFNPSPTFNPQPTNSNKLSPIAFILSSPRSGSTLLRVMLAGHPALLSPPELHLLPFNSMGERSQELALSHLGEGLQRAFMELKGIDAQQSQALVEDLIEKDLSIERIYAMLLEQAGDRLLVDKSPTYAFHREILERAEALFADAKYIHLVRHPYAVIESFCRMRMDKLIGLETADPDQLAESIWTRSNQNILDFFAAIAPERHHLVRYEELVTEPSRVMQELCQFLDLGFDPSMLKPYEGKRMTDGIYNQSLSLGDPNFRKHDQIDPSLGEAWKDIQLPHQLAAEARQIAAALQYKLSSPSVSPCPMHETYVEVRGLKLCLCTWGPETGRLVLCLHGILDQGAAWEEVAVRLANQGYRVVAPDLRGHGRSAHVEPGSSYNLLDFLGDIDAIASGLSKPLLLVGHSLGSVVAAMYASIRPERVERLVLVETILPTEADDTEAAAQLATHLNYLASPPEHRVFPDVATAAQRLRLATPALSELRATKLAQRLTEPCPGGVRWRWAPLLQTRAGIGFNGISRSRYLSLLRQIQAPTTLVYGDSSSFNRGDDLDQQHSAMPNAERKIISGGHNLHLDAPADLARIIDD